MFLLHAFLTNHVSSELATSSTFMWFRTSTNRLKYLSHMLVHPPLVTMKSLCDLLSLLKPLT